MKRFLLFVVIAFISLSAFSQNNTFIFLNSSNDLYSISVNKSGNTCSTPVKLTACSGNNPNAIALFNNILYYTDNSGVLYSSTYDSTKKNITNCKKLGTFKFTNLSGIFGLTVDSKGVVYAASDNQIQTYDPVKGFSSTVHSINTNWAIAGDLIFWGGHLYEACNDSKTNSQVMIQIDTAKYTNNIVYLTFKHAATTAGQVYGIASVKVPCKFNQVYAITKSGDIYSVDMYGKKEDSLKAICPITGLGNINDAASTAEAGLDQSPPSPANPKTPNNLCVGQPFNFQINISDPTNDTLRWYIAPNLPPPNKPDIYTGMPVVNTKKVGSDTFRITEFNIKTQCESDTVAIVINIHPYPHKPIISPLTDTVCNGSTDLINGI